MISRALRPMNIFMPFRVNFHFQYLENEHYNWTSPCIRRRRPYLSAWCINAEKMTTIWLFILTNLNSIYSKQNRVTNLHFEKFMWYISLSKIQCVVVKKCKKKKCNNIHKVNSYSTYKKLLLNFVSGEIVIKWRNAEPPFVQYA